MKKFIKYSLILLAAIVSVFLIIIGVIYLSSLNVKFDDSKLMTINDTLTFLDVKDNKLEKSAKLLGQSDTTYDELPEHLVNAIVSVEDKHFFQHKGVDYKRIVKATINNAKSFSYKEGASTITQQLIKNTHLENKKNLKRKFSEIRLAKELEKKYSKQEILSMYLNVIYFGNNCYGIKNAAKNYLDKDVENLTLSECAMFAGLIKAPSRLAPTENFSKCMERRDLVLKIMLNDSVITNDEYEQAKDEVIVLKHTQNQNIYSNYINEALLETSDILGLETEYLTSSGYKIFTYLDTKKQQQINDVMNLTDYNSHNIYNGISIIIDNKTNGVECFYSNLFTNVKEIRRQAGSIIKPLLVYSPAIEKGVISPITPINDAYTDFDGYKPTNYDKRFKGFISAKTALSESRNIPAIKVLQYTGIGYCKNFASKFDIDLQSDNDNLSIALGASSAGVSPLTLVNAYTTYANNGKFQEAAFVRKITDKDNKVIYENKQDKINIFKPSTAYLTTDMLLECKKNGTAKLLSHLPYDVACKTGTVGNDKGNTDAYIVSYTTDSAFLVWLGSRDNINMMSCDVTGGGVGATLLKSILENVYDKKTPDSFIIPNEVEKIAIDSISLSEDKIVEKAESNAPSKYIEYSYFEKGCKLPLSKRFSMPKINNVQIQKSSDKIKISFEAKKYYNYKVYRKSFFEDDELIKTINNLNAKVTVTDIYNEFSSYEIVPYFISSNGEIIEGEKFVTQIII